jgi:hypothetical protein
MSGPFRARTCPYSRLAWSWPPRWSLFFCLSYINIDIKHGLEGRKTYSTLGPSPQLTKQPGHHVAAVAPDKRLHHLHGTYLLLQLLCSCLIFFFFIALRILEPMGQVLNFCFLFSLLCWGCQWISRHLPSKLLTVCCVTTSLPHQCLHRRLPACLSLLQQFSLLLYTHGLHHWPASPSLSW